MKQKLALITSSLLVSCGTQHLYLGEPITVRLSTKDFDIIEIQALHITEEREVFIMNHTDGYGYPQEVWQKLSELSEAQQEKIVDAIYNWIMKCFKQEVCHDL